MPQKLSAIRYFIIREYRIALNFYKPVFPSHAGIFGYLNYLTPRTKQYILESLVKGLQRLEYRGYDSAGVAFDSDEKVSVQGFEGNKIRYTIWISSQTLHVHLNFKCNYV